MVDEGAAKLLFVQSLQGVLSSTFLAILFSSGLVIMVRNLIVCSMLLSIPSL